MKKIKLLDCTLRDGGYINGWNFSNKHILKILDSLYNSKIDIIELGYLNYQDGKNNDSTLFDEIDSVDRIIRKLELNDIEKVIMINFGDYDVVKLPLQNQSKIDGIRLAFHKKDLEKALESGRKLIELGYKLYFQPMVTKNYSDLEFLSLIIKVNKLNPFSFYIVDSFGSMTLDEFHRYLILADANLDKDITLGYHSHNNMQLAFSNAVSMCSMNLRRDIIIDASIYGIGRGAGNLNTELIADFVNKSYSTHYDTLPLLEVIDEFLNSLMKEKPWGFTPAQFLSATYNCHPNYATYLINKNTNYIVGIKKILEKLPDDKKSSFDYQLIEQLYIDSILEEKTVIQGKFNIPKNKRVVLLASGKSILNYKELIEQIIKQDCIVIALNHIPDFKCDYYFFTNQKRYDEFEYYLNASQVVITNNIKMKTKVLAVLDFRKLVFTDTKLVVNVAVVCLNYLCNVGFKEVYIAGLDGYKENSDNYNYLETSYISDSNALLEQNNILSQALDYLKKKIELNFLTPTILIKKDQLKVVGIIPARYKSTRFEGKPLCLINNVPMIKRTYLQAKKSQLLDELIVATESVTIKEYCMREKIPVIMTSQACLTGTDRIAEVARSINADLYVNIQGDEPVIDPKSIDEIVSEYKIHTDKYIAYNLYKYINEKDEISTDTIIKVITNEKDELMYMSRLGIPFNKLNNEAKYKKQVCVYGFTKKALDIFSSRAKTQNEQYEDIEILRFVDMGYTVKMKETKVDSIAVDIPSDVQKVERFLEQKGLK